MTIQSLRRILGLFVSRLSGSGIQFLLQIVTARLLGSQAVGLLGVAQGNVLLFGSMANGGTGPFVLRRTANVSRPRSSMGERQWLAFCVVVTMVLGSLLGGGLFVLWMLTENDYDGVLSTVVGLFMALAVLCYGTAKVYFEYMKGRGAGARSLSLEYTIPYAASLVAALCAAAVGLWLSSMAWIAALPAVAFCLSFAMVLLWLRFIRFRVDHVSIGWGALWRRLRRVWKELATFTLIQVGNQAAFSLPVAMTFAISGAAEAGLIVIVLKLVGLTATISAVFSAYFSPRVVNAYRSSDRPELRRLYVQSMTLNGTACALICVAMLLFPTFFMGLFGEDFLRPEAQLALQICCAGRIVRQYAGMTEVFLAMTGNASWDVFSQIVSVAILVLGLIGIGLAGYGHSLVLLAIVVTLSTTIRPLVALPFVWQRVLA